jgi:hypothetical protein
MQLVALLLATDYEGEMLLGVYSSEETAQAAADAFLEHQGSLSGDQSFVYHDVQLDGVAEYHW